MVGGKNEERTAIAECERFNLTKRSSKIVQRLLEERVHCALVEGINNQGQLRLFAIGGTGVSGQQLKSIESIDTSIGENAVWER